VHISFFSEKFLFGIPGGQEILTIVHTYSLNIYHMKTEVFPIACIKIRNIFTVVFIGVHFTPLKRTIQVLTLLILTNSI